MNTLPGSRRSYVDPTDETYDERHPFHRRSKPVMALMSSTDATGRDVGRTARDLGRRRLMSRPSGQRVGDGSVRASGPGCSKLRRSPGAMAIPAVPGALLGARRDLVGERATNSLRPTPRSTSPPRGLTPTVVAARSSSPTTRMYGIFSIFDERIRLPSASFASMTSTRTSGCRQAARGRLRRTPRAPSPRGAPEPAPAPATSGSSRRSARSSRP